jgi:hypothetical protein
MFCLLAKICMRAKLAASLAVIGKKRPILASCHSPTEVHYPGSVGVSVSVHRSTGTGTEAPTGMCTVVCIATLVKSNAICGCSGQWHCAWLCLLVWLAAVHTTIPASLQATMHHRHHTFWDCPVACAVCQQLSQAFPPARPC